MVHPSKRGSSVGTEGKEGSPEAHDRTDSQMVLINEDVVTSTHPYLLLFVCFCTRKGK